MTYQTTGAVDFEEIIVGTRTLDDHKVKISKYIDTYGALEMKIRDKGLAQSLPEYLATQYWLMNLSAERIADEIMDISAVFVDANFVRDDMMAELNIPRRNGSKGGGKVV